MGWLCWDGQPRLHVLQWGSHIYLWSVSRLIGGWQILDLSMWLHMTQWLGLLAGVPQFLSMWPFPIASPGFLIRPHEIKEGENGNYMTFCGLGWKSHIVTCTAFCWPKQVTKLGLNQEVGKQPLPIDWRSCKEFVAVFNPPRVGIHYLVNKGQRSHLLVERLQLSRCKLLINH